MKSYEKQQTKDKEDNKYYLVKNYTTGTYKELSTHSHFNIRGYALQGPACIQQRKNVSCKKSQCMVIGHGLQKSVEGLVTLKTNRLVIEVDN